MVSRLPGALTAALAIGLVSLAPASSSAQATRDQPMLTMGIAGGYIIGNSRLWRVPNQPVLAGGQTDRDIFDISRNLTGNVTLAVQATLFRSPHVGYSAELSYMGIGTSDRCSLVQATGNTTNRNACTRLNRETRSTSTTSLLGGVVLRPLSRSLLQPYARLEGGLSLMGDNLVGMTSYVSSNTIFNVYPVRTGISVRPTGVLGIGVATNTGTGYMMRLEARQTWMTINQVTGPSEYNGQAPPIGSVVRGFPSLSFGFDIVLEKSRGRRY